jgi:hypothetical protein
MNDEEGLYLFWETDPAGDYSRPGRACRSWVIVVGV